MNKQTLVELFKNNLIGKPVPYGSYFFRETPLLKLVREQLEKEGVDQKIIRNVLINHDNRGNGFSVDYRSITLAYFKYHTTTTSNYIRYYGYEKAFKNFECSTPDFELSEKVKEIDKFCEDRENKRHDELAKRAEDYKKIKELFGEETDQIIGYLQMNRYSIRKYLEENEK